jgi:hypothetical protein
LSTHTGLRRLRAAACGLDTLDRFEVAAPLAHLPVQRSERAALEADLRIAPVAVKLCLSLQTHTSMIWYPWRDSNSQMPRV